MRALSSLDECRSEANGLSIWQNLLEAESTALNDASRTNAKYTDPVIGIRLLGFFLKDFRDHAQDGYLGYPPYNRMEREITSCLDKPDKKAIYDALVKLGLMYRNYLLRVCELHDYLARYSECTKLHPVRSNAGGRPTSSQHSSRPSFEVIKGRVLEELGALMQTKSNVKKTGSVSWPLCRTSAHLPQALLCDGYRCAISGIYDMQSCFDIEEIDVICKASGNPLLIETEVAHIFSESAQDGDKVST